jgi:Rrf2 family protein
MSSTQTRLARRLLVITAKSAYAVRALAELARRGGSPVPIGEVAARRDMSPQFLESLFVTLRRGGVLQSQRGVKGGYSLARPAEEITVLEVVELLEGEVGTGAEHLGPPWSEIAEQVRAKLAGTTVAEVAQREAQEAGAAMYYI